MVRDPSAPAAAPRGEMRVLALIAGSVGLHIAIFAAMATIEPPDPGAGAFATVTVDVEPLEDPAPEPPEPEPPAVVPAKAPPPPRRRRVRRNPSPPAAVLTASEDAGGAAGPSVEEGVSGGAMDGAGGVGTELTSTVAPPAPPPPAPSGPSRAELRRLLRQYLRETVFRYVGEHIELPYAIRRQARSGVTRLAIRIARDGRILGARLRRSCGHPDLDDATLRSFRALGSLPAPPAQLPWSETTEITMPIYHVAQ